jgi:hypothetical protein
LGSYVGALIFFSGWVEFIYRMSAKVGKKKLMVREKGLEPPWITPPDPKSGASANSATLARSPSINMKACFVKNLFEIYPAACIDVISG